MTYNRLALSRAPSCVTCGTQFPEAKRMDVCPVCSDERQYVGWEGQRWTTSAAIAAEHEVRFEDCAGVTTLSLTPGFAIGQRAFLIPQAGGMVMWECLPTVTDAAVARIAELSADEGGVQAIAISHPHFYSAVLEWSAALGGVPIYLNEADEAWVRFDSPFLRFWGRRPLHPDRRHRPRAPARPFRRQLRAVVEDRAAPRRQPVHRPTR